MVEAINEFLNRDPFFPVRIVIASGSSCAVSSPCQLVIEASRIRCYHSETEGVAILRLNRLAAKKTIVDSADVAG